MQNCCICLIGKTITKKEQQQNTLMLAAWLETENCIFPAGENLGRPAWLSLFVQKERKNSGNLCCFFEPDRVGDLIRFSESGERKIKVFLGILLQDPRLSLAVCSPVSFCWWDMKGALKKKKAKERLFEIYCAWLVGGWGLPPSAWGTGGWEEMRRSSLVLALEETWVMGGALPFPLSSRIPQLQTKQSLLQKSGFIPASWGDRRR